MGGGGTGCGRNRDGDRAYAHWFDGDGHISKVGTLRALALTHFLLLFASVKTPGGGGDVLLVLSFSPTVLIEFSSKA